MKKNSSKSSMNNLKKNVSPIATGIATGAVVGTAMYMLSNKKDTKKAMKHTAGMALKAVGSVMEKLY